MFKSNLNYNVHFVWLTDGAGWIKAKKNLKETYDVQDDIYNINDLKNGIIKKGLSDGRDIKSV